MIRVTVYLSEKEKSNPSVPVQFYADGLAEFTSDSQVVYWGSTDVRTRKSTYVTYVLRSIIGFSEEEVDE